MARLGILVNYLQIVAYANLNSDYAQNHFPAFESIEKNKYTFN